MYELIQNLIAFKYACKINHWSTDDYSEHLLYDRLLDEIDIFVDDLAEKHFMAYNKKSVFKADLLNSKLINRDLVRMISNICKILEKLQKDKSLDAGIVSYLGDIEKSFLSKLALAQLK